jgi:hypothetical protein
MPLIYGITIIFGIQFATIHVLAEVFELYWRYPWLDIPMHICGGVLLLLIIGSLQQLRALPSFLLQSWRVPTLLGLILLAWEGFGIYRFGGLKPDFWVDSSLDLVCGVIGIIGGYYLVALLKRLT